jgi:GT2 family glycosyltransferase
MTASATPSSGRVGVVVLNYNGKRLAERCLRTVFDEDGVEKEVILVDNASSDGSVEHVQARFPQVVVLEPGENLGVTGGRNLGFREAVRRGCDYVLSLDNDSAIEPSCIETLTLACASDPRIAVVGPKTYADEEGTRVLQCVGGAIDFTENVTRELGAGQLDVGQYDQRREVDYFPGSGFMARAKIMEQLGYLDESFYGYGHEDTDFCYRAKRRGYRIVYVPQAVMRHGGTTTMGGYSPRRKYLEAVNSVYFVRKYATPLQRCKYAWYAGFGLIYALAIHGPKGNAKAVFAKARGIWRGLRKPIGQHPEQGALPKAASD